jgi:hypothetical protein
MNFVRFQLVITTSTLLLVEALALCAYLNIQLVNSSLSAEPTPIQLTALLSLLMINNL